MKFTATEQEKIVDSVLKIQSVRASLGQVPKEKLAERDQMDDCLEGVDDGLRKALGYPKRGNQKPS